MSFYRFREIIGFRTLFFLRFIYLFMIGRERERERERGAETQEEPDAGLDLGTPGSRPGPKAGAKPLRHPGIPSLMVLNDQSLHFPRK